jgi:hypothetical protein
MNKIFAVIDQMGLTDVSLRYDYVGEGKIAWIACITYAGLILSEQEADTREHALTHCVSDICDKVKRGEIDIAEMHNFAKFRMNGAIMNERYKPIEVDRWHRLK